MLTNRSLRASAVALTIVGTACAPGVAQAGFFEQLFGMQSPAPQPAAPSYGYGYDGQPASRAPRVRHRKHVAAVENKSARQTPTDIMHDATLRSGDAVMTKTGIHIYEGDPSHHHESDEFVALDSADHVSRKQRDALLAMDTTRNDPLRGKVTPDTIASGRSASVSVPSSIGYRITDARGNSIRYVGP